MTILSTTSGLTLEYLAAKSPGKWPGRWAALSALVFVVIVPLSGCRGVTPLYDTDLVPYSSVSLREGDTVIITFPGSPNLNATQQIRRDGKIDLQLVGEVMAAGRTPAELEKELLKLYEPQLVLKQVSVTLQSSSYPVFVSGSVVKPGKIMAERPLSDLEAIMEAGGFDPAKADMRNVIVFRHENGQVKRYKRNLKRVLEKKGQLFYLRPGDIIYVPEKIF